jgi:hypothetical protein
MTDGVIATLMYALGVLVLCCCTCGIFGYKNFKKNNLSEFPWETPSTTKSERQLARKAAKQNGADGTHKKGKKSRN